MAKPKTPGSFNDFMEAHPGLEDDAAGIGAYTSALAERRRATLIESGVSDSELHYGSVAMTGFGAAIVPVEAEQPPTSIAVTSEV